MSKSVRLPLMPMIAPVVLSVVMALVLQSALALVMGILGPLMVLGGWWHQKKTATKDNSDVMMRHEEAQSDYDSAVAAARILERERAARALPSAAQWSVDPLWREPTILPGLVRIGEGWWEPPAGHPLHGTAAVVGMPAAVETSSGLAVIGGVECAEVWRNVVVQWWMASGAGGLEPELSDSGEPFPTDIRGVSRAVWVSTVAEVPQECLTLLIVGRDPVGVIHRQGEAPRRVKFDRLSHAEALRALRSHHRVIEQVQPVVNEVNPRKALRASLSAQGPSIDLVAEGPHAVVWGATGSGKSHTVCSLVLSLAQSYSPHDLVCVVIDFKGGAGLRPVTSLPHTIGTVTDLDPVRSHRARVGLQAEMVYRETIMNHHQVADVADLPPSVWCPRLLVVVDEVAWLCTNEPDWAHTLSDIAQRGRSLGIHLVLSTQRVSGVLSRALMANVSVRICGRVSDDLEVAEWMPDLSGAHKNSLRHVSPGRVLVASSTSAPAWHSVALASEWEVSRVGPHTQWRVWTEELPALIAPTPGIWGWADRPERQTHEELIDDPCAAGSVAIIGDEGSGKTATALALAAQSTISVRAPADPAGVWACLRENDRSQVSVIIDDADHLLHRAGAEGEVFLMDALEAFEGRLIVTMGPRHRLSRGLVRLAPQRLVLSVAAGDELTQWGGLGQVAPGRCLFQGAVVQITYPHRSPPVWTPHNVASHEESLIVMTETPDSWRAARARFIGTPDQVMARWSELCSEIPGLAVVVDGIGHREARMASSGRIALPPLTPLPGWVWVWRGGTAVLARSTDLGRSPQ